MSSLERHAMDTPPHLRNDPLAQPGQVQKRPEGASSRPPTGVHIHVHDRHIGTVAKHGHVRADDGATVDEDHWSPESEVATSERGEHQTNPETLAALTASMSALSSRTGAIEVSVSELKTSVDGLAYKQERDFGHVINGLKTVSDAVFALDSTVKGVTHTQGAIDAAKGAKDEAQDAELLALRDSNATLTSRLAKLERIAGRAALVSAPLYALAEIASRVFGNESLTRFILEHLSK